MTSNTKTKMGKAITTDGRWQRTSADEGVAMDFESDLDLLGPLWPDNLKPKKAIGGFKQFQTCS